MEVSVTGRKIEVGDALRVHVSDKINSITGKYFSRTVDASVVIAKEGHNYKVNCHLHAPKSVNLQSQGEAGEVYAAFDLAAEKIEKQLRRYKRRIKNHHKLGGKEYEIPTEEAQ
jgi:ribosomal subunit interface protein